MRKKLLTIILTLTIVLQILTPVGMIAYGNKAKEELLSKGIDYKVRVSGVNIEDGYVTFWSDDICCYSYKKYIIIGTSDNGYAEIIDFTDSKPDCDNYIRSSEQNQELLTRYKIDEKKEISYLYIPSKEAYATIKVYNGDAAVTGVFVDGVSVEEYIKNIGNDIPDDELIIFDEYVSAPAISDKQYPTDVTGDEEYPTDVEIDDELMIF